MRYEKPANTEFWGFVGVCGHVCSVVCALSILRGRYAPPLDKAGSGVILRRAQDEGVRPVKSPLPG